MKYDFSIVIPFWKRKYELNLVLKALTLQDYNKNKFEIILVDDGSDNKIDELIKKYSKELNINYLYLKHTANRGYIRNYGVQKSNGEKIIFLDCDIIPEFNMISGFEHATRGKSRYISIGYRNMLFEFDRKFLDEKTIENNFDIVRKFPARRDTRFMTTEHEKKTGTKMDGRWQLLYTNCVCIPKDEYEAIGGFDEIFSENWGAEDIELGYRLYRNGCTIEMNDRVLGYHIPHPEDWQQRIESLKKNYNIFIHKHKHWSVELFIREYETLSNQMIQFQEKIKKREYIIKNIKQMEDVLKLLPEKTLLCGIEIPYLIKSDKIKRAFIPESKIQSHKIDNIIGINTDLKDKYFEYALVSERYQDINYGISEMLYAELQRISKKILKINENTDIVLLLSYNKLQRHVVRKKILFLISAFETYSIYKYYINLAIALHQKGVVTGYNVFFDPFFERHPNRGIMRTLNPKKIEIIQKLFHHELDFLGDNIASIMDSGSVKYSTRCIGKRILWEEIKYYNEEKEFLQNIIPFYNICCPRREDDIKFYPGINRVEYLPVGIDSKKIKEIKCIKKNNKRKFTFLWADWYTDIFSNLHIILKAFTELFKDNENVELKIIHNGNNTIFVHTQNVTPMLNKIYRNTFFYKYKLYSINFDQLYYYYKDFKNIHFYKGELSEEEYSYELYECDCFIHINSIMRINPWVLESIAFGKRPVILDNNNYKGYFLASNCFKVKTYCESAFIGEPEFDTVRLGVRDLRRYYLLDFPLKESLKEIMLMIYNDSECVMLNDGVTDAFINRFNWLIIAEQLKKIL